MKDINTKNNCYNFSRMALKGDVMKKLAKRSFATITAVSLMTAGFMLAGCGGSGGRPSSQVVSGTAAVGDPLSGKVTLKDSSTTSVPIITPIGTDGSFSIDVTGMKAPFILQADGTAHGQTYRLHSFAEGAGTANVNPLSDALVDSSCDNESSEEVYMHPDSAKLERIKVKIQISVSDLMEKIRPLLIKFKADGKHPIKDECKADHRGLDGVFDYVNITIVDGILTITNKKTGAVIFTGSVRDIKHGHFTDNDDDLPQLPAIPVAPGNVTALGGTGEVTLSWNTVSNATAYNIYYATSPGVTPANGIKIADAATPYVQSGLTAGSTYYFIITAVNSAGEGAASVQTSAGTASTSPLPTVPAAPAVPTATGGTNQVTLTWSAVSNATSYNVYFSTSPGVTKTNGTKITNATSPAVLGTLTAGSTYYYIVTAENGTGEGAASGQVAATTLTDVPKTAPAAPTAVTAAGGANQATISWAAVSGATSYNLYWSTTTGVSNSNGTKVTGVTSPYAKTELAEGSTYYFIVTAANSVGESAASTQASAATNAVAVTPVCGSCHAIPPAVGQHSKHSFTSCATCHGTGYSSTTVNAATHANGTKDVGGTSGWDATARSCSNSCHGSRSW